MKIGRIKLVAIAITSLMAWIISLWCFYPVVSLVLTAIKQRAIERYESTPGYMYGDWGNHEYIDTTYAKWAESLCRYTRLDSVATVEFDKREIISRYNKMVTEISFCRGCDGYPEFVRPSIEAKIAEVERTYYTWRSGMVARYGEEAVASREASNKMYDQLEQHILIRTLKGFLWLALLSYFASCLTHYIQMLFSAKLQGYKIIYEALTPDRAPLAALLYPVMYITKFPYPRGAPIETVKRALGYAYALLISCFTWGAGIASAQTPLGANLSKRLGQQSLVVDYTVPMQWQPPQADSWRELVKQPDPIIPSGEVNVSQSQTPPPNKKNWFKLTRLQGMFNAGPGAKVFTPEVAVSVQLGPKVSASSLWFCEFRPGLNRPQSYICAGNIAVSETKRPWLSVFGEPGFTARGKSFALGGRVTLTTIPTLKTFFAGKLKHLSVSPMLKVRGPVTSRQILFAGRSADFNIGKFLKIYAEGIYRLRAGPDYSWVDFRMVAKKFPWLALGGQWEPLVNRWMFGPRLIFR